MLYRGLLLLMLLLLAARAPAGAAEPAVALVASERSESYEEAIVALAAELGRGGYSRADMAVLLPAEVDKLAGISPRIVVALGTAAAQALAGTDSKAPQLHLLLTRHGFLQIGAMRKIKSQTSAIYLDQPATRQLRLLRLALPEHRRVGLLLGPVSQVQEPAFRSAATELGLQLASASAERGESLYPALQKLLVSTDVVLAVADPSVFNANTIQNILLSTFRARVPLFAFSPAYVKAGALLALYSTPAQIGAQAGRAALAVLQGKPLPAPQYPAEYTLSVNSHVARALGLYLDEADLYSRLRQIERAP